MGPTGSEVISARSWDPYGLSRGHHRLLSQMLGVWPAQRPQHTHLGSACSLCLREPPHLPHTWPLWRLLKSPFVRSWLVGTTKDGHLGPFSVLSECVVTSSYPLSHLVGILMKATVGCGRKEQVCGTPGFLVESQEGLMHPAGAPSANSPQKEELFFSSSCFCGFVCYLPPSPRRLSFPLGGNIRKFKIVKSFFFDKC